MRLLRSLRKWENAAVQRPHSASSRISGGMSGPYPSSPDGKPAGRLTGVTGGILWYREREWIEGRRARRTAVNAEARGMTGAPLVCPFCGTTVPLRRRRCGGCRAAVRYGLPPGTVAALAVAGVLSVLYAAGLVDAAMDAAVGAAGQGPLPRLAGMLFLAAGVVLLHRAGHGQTVRFLSPRRSRPAWPRRRADGSWHTAGNS